MYVTWLPGAETLAVTFIFECTFRGCAFDVGGRAGSPLGSPFGARPRRPIFAVVLTFLPFLESILGYLSRLGGYLGLSWGRPGATPRTSWTVLGNRGGRFGPSEADCGGVREQPIRLLGAVGTPARVARGPRGRATKRGDRAKQLA